MPQRYEPEHSIIMLRSDSSFGNELKVRPFIAHPRTVYFRENTTGDIEGAQICSSYHTLPQSKPRPQ